MASIVFNATVRDMVNAYLGSGTYKMLLLTTVPGETQKDSWAFRSDVTGEVANGNGYTTGGVAVTLTVAAVDNANNDVEVSVSNGVWNSATITAAAALIYKDNGSAATDRVIGTVDFGGNVSSTASTFTAQVTTPLKFQN